MTISPNEATKKRLQKSGMNPNPKTDTTVRKSRRALLRNGLGAAIATVGVGTMLEVSPVEALGSSPSRHNVAPNDNPGNFSSSNPSIAAVGATGTNGAHGVYATSDSGYGVYAQSSSYIGVYALSNSNAGVVAASSSSDGLYAQSSSSNGVQAVSGSSTAAAVLAENTSSGIGVKAISKSGTALAVSGTIAVSGNAVGTATLPRGQVSVTVTTPAATTSSNIMLTALSKYKGSIWVIRASGSFTIEISAAQTSNVTFTYLIIN